MTSRTGDSRAGFTLTELLVVIAIIMTLAATAVPALSAFRSGQRLEQAARVVQATLAHARRVAITKRARHVVVFYKYEETPGELDTTRHAMRIYQEPTGIKPGTPNVPDSVTKGYWPGGYVGKPVVLPAGVRFKQALMECTVNQGLPDESSELFQKKLRGEQTDALAFRRDGSVEERKDAPATETSGRNIYLPDERCFQVPEATRADIVVVQTPVGAANDDEVKTRGKKQRALVDVNLATGRVLSRVFEIGGTAPEFLPPTRSGGGGN